MPKAKVTVVKQGKAGLYVPNTRIGAYKFFWIHHEVDGWWAENDGGSCYGPFDTRDEAHAAVDKAWQAHVQTPS